MNKNYEQLKEVIQKAVPDIMELDIGSRVYVNKEFGINGYGNIQCVKSYREPLGEVSLYGHNVGGKSYNIKEILGRPIRLADCTYCVKHLCTQISIQDLKQKMFTLVDLWTGTKDNNLDNQSIEVKEYLYNVLLENN